MATHFAQLKSMVTVILTASGTGAARPQEWQRELSDHASGAAHCLRSASGTASKHTLSEASQASLAIANVLAKHSFQPAAAQVLAVSMLQIMNALPKTHPTLRRSVQDSSVDVLSRALRAAAAGDVAGWGHAQRLLAAADACSHMRSYMPQLIVKVMSAATAATPPSPPSEQALWDAAARVQPQWLRSSQHAGSTQELLRLVPVAAAQLVQGGVLPPPQALPFLPAAETGAPGALTATGASDAIAHLALQQMQANGCVSTLVHTVQPLMASGLLSPGRLQAAAAAAATALTEDGSACNLLTARRGAHGSALELLRWCVAAGVPCGELTAAVAGAVAQTPPPPSTPPLAPWQLARLSSLRRIAGATKALQAAVPLVLDGPLAASCEAAHEALQAAVPRSSALQRDVALQVARADWVRPFRSEHKTGTGEIVDMAWPEQRVVLEVQGPHHAQAGGGSGRVATPDTNLKRRLLQAEGWSVVEVWYDEWQHAVETGSQQALLGTLLPETVFRAAQPPAVPSPNVAGGRGRTKGRMQPAAPPAWVDGPIRGLDSRLRGHVATGGSGLGLASSRAMHSTAAAAARNKRRGGAAEAAGGVIDVEGGVVDARGQRVDAQHSAQPPSGSSGGRLADVDAMEAKLAAQLADLQAGFGAGAEDDLEAMHRQVQAGGGGTGGGDLDAMQQAQALLGQLNSGDNPLGGDFEAELRSLFEEEAGGDSAVLAELGLGDALLQDPGSRSETAAYRRAMAKGAVDMPEEGDEHTSAALAAAKTRALEAGAAAAGVEVTRDLVELQPERTRDFVLDGMQRLGMRPNEVFSEYEMEEALGYHAGEGGEGGGRQGRRRRGRSEAQAPGAFHRKSTAAARSGAGLSLDDAVAAVGRDAGADVGELANAVLRGEGGGGIEGSIATSSLSEREADMVRRIRAQVEAGDATPSELRAAREAMGERAAAVAAATGRGADLGQQAASRAASGAARAGGRAQEEAAAALAAGTQEALGALGEGGVRVLQGGDGLPMLEGVDTSVAHAAALQALRDVGPEGVEGGDLPLLQGGVLSQLIQELRDAQAATALGPGHQWRKRRAAVGRRAVVPATGRPQRSSKRTVARVVAAARAKRTQLLTGPSGGDDDALQQLGAALGTPQWETLSPSAQRAHWHSAVREASEGVVAMAQAAGMSRSDMAQVFTQQLVPGIRAAFSSAPAGSPAAAVLNTAVRDFTEGALGGDGAMRLLATDSPAAQALLDDIEQGILGKLPETVVEDGKVSLESWTPGAAVTWRQVDASCGLPSPQTALRMALQHARRHAQRRTDVCASIIAAGGQLKGGKGGPRAGEKGAAAAALAADTDAQQAPGNTAGWDKQRWARVHWHRLRRLGAVAAAAGVPAPLLTAALRSAGVAASPAAINKRWRTQLVFTAAEPLEEVELHSPGAADVRVWEAQADADGWVRQGGVAATPAQLAAFQDLLSGAGTRGTVVQAHDEEAQMDALLELMRRQQAAPAAGAAPPDGRAVKLRSPRVDRWGDAAQRKTSDDVMDGFDLEGMSQQDAAELRSAVLEMQAAAAGEGGVRGQGTGGRMGSAATAARDADELAGMGGQFMDSTGEAILQSSLQGMMQGASTGEGSLAEAAAAGGLDPRLVAGMDTGGQTSTQGLDDAREQSQRIARDFAQRTNSAAGGAAAAAAAVRPTSSSAEEGDVAELLRSHGLGEFEGDAEVQEMFQELLAAGASKGDLAAAMRAAGEEAATAAQGWESDGEHR